jgi:hypothetical protein
MRGAGRWLVGAALAAASVGALAQDKCAMVPDGMRARCEEAMRVKKACEGLTGDALKTCQQKNVDYGATKENCAALQGEARARCEQHNRSAAAADACNGKTGAELEQCVKSQAAARASPK